MKAITIKQPWATLIALGEKKTANSKPQRIRIKLEEVPTFKNFLRFPCTCS